MPGVGGPLPFRDTFSLEDAHSRGLRHRWARCIIYAPTGCHPFELLVLTAEAVGLAAAVPVIENVQKPRTRVYRALPIPCPAVGERNRSGNQCVLIKRVACSAVRWPVASAPISFWKRRMASRVNRPKIPSMCP